jgi:hypothetical protein
VEDMLQVLKEEKVRNHCLKLIVINLSETRILEEDMLW